MFHARVPRPVPCYRVSCALACTMHSQLQGMAELPHAAQIKLPEQPHSRLASVLGPALGNSKAGTRMYLPQHVLCST